MKDRIRQLARLSEIQRLKKSGHETRLAALEAEIAALGEEQAALLALQDRHYETGGGFIPLSAIVSRIDAVLKRKDELDALAARTRQDFLEASRMQDRVDEKHLAELRLLERAESAHAIEEALAHRIGRKDSSLP